MLAQNALALLLLVLLWCGAFILFPLLRKEQLVSSFLAGALFPVLHIATVVQDAGAPSVAELGLLFLAGGIASVAYHIVFGQFYLQTPKHFIEKPKSNEFLFWKWLGSFFALCWIMITLSFVWPNANEGLLLLLTGVILLLFIVAKRKDLLFDAIMSSVLMVALFAMVDVVTTGEAVIAVNAELYIKAAGLGLFFGPLYELIRNTKLHAKR